MKTRSGDTIDHGELILLFIAINRTSEKKSKLAAFCQRGSIDLRTLYHDAASDRNDKSSVFSKSIRAKAALADLKSGRNKFN